jgi:hypothetical protein
MNSNRPRHLAIILLTVGMVSAISALLLAADPDFSGTWKGQYNAAAAPAPAPAPSETPAGGGGSRGGGGGGGRGGGGGGAPAGFGGGGGPQKITLRVKVNKDHVSGNFTIGSSNPEDLREGKIEGTKLTFKTGTAPAATYVNQAVLMGDMLAVTRTAEGGRGGKPMEFTLTRGK